MADERERPEEAQEAGGDTVPSGGDATPSVEAATDPWAPFDEALQAFDGGRGLALGTYWGESASVVAGRFVGWANAAGWRCTLQLVRPPDQDVVVLVAEGPPLPGGRARLLPLGGFPPQFDVEMLRAMLELGYHIGETWGPSEEASSVDPAAAPGGTGGTTSG